ncbi:MAG: hypothetical protein KME25_33500 [Symplocastrum torsivum CPER-KK1]|jgi:hypothetical protein|uniref:Uncharacterized protein n=1 Tax=Symplocastrum torsivum CPER-KK1 TaxID=450513 RepID=A0A951PUL5_9CYAN|nr:hypothetical protein [Symplocastrum torsivum CPER-KK1]
MQQQHTKKPFTAADESYLSEVVIECKNRLESALSTAQGYSRVPQLATSLADAVTAVGEAAAILQDIDSYSD